MLVLLNMSLLIYRLLILKKSIAKILLEEGYIKNIEEIDDGKQGIIRVNIEICSE